MAARTRVTTTTRRARRARTLAPRPRGRPRRYPWAKLPIEEVLDWRLCDLGLRIAGSVLERRIARLYNEFEARGLRFRPHFWLSTEWFTPDGVPGIAMPFYLAHPRLAQVEEKQMLEVEGGTADWCMRILRHEAGHAIDNAYQLHRRRKWQRLFGRSTEPYPDSYRPRPHSRRYVQHLDDWYAQSHPSEDFAETFAVWLTRRSNWRRRYHDWPALKKLEYVDELMKEIAEEKPVVTTREHFEPIRALRITIREYYARKRERYGGDYPDFYDLHLRRLFSAAPANRHGESAAHFLRRIRPELRRLVSQWTGGHQYVIDQVLREMTARCRVLRLRLDRPPSKAKLEATILLTARTMNYLLSGRRRLL